MKIHKILFITILGFAYFQNVNSQDTDLLDARFKKYAKPDRSKLSKHRQIFSWDWKFSYATDFFGTLEREYSFINNTTLDTFSRRDNVTAISLMSAGFEPRWNLRQYNKNALGIKLATHINFSMTQHTITEGVLHGSQAAFVFFGRGYAGPYNDFSERGFAINLGVISVMAPIFGYKESKDRFEEFYTPLPGSKSYARRLFFLPVMQLDLYNNNPLKNRPTVMSITAGYMSGTYLFRFNFGLPY